MTQISDCFVQGQANELAKIIPGTLSCSDEKIRLPPIAGGELQAGDPKLINRCGACFSNVERVKPSPITHKTAPRLWVWRLGKKHNRVVCQCKLHFAQQRLKRSDFLIRAYCRGQPANNEGIAAYSMST
ncbi:hypothetical protein [Methylomonas rhizoryzae]|uniref:hypothetical protein n=1 Tax=Methylomonas rhizoryzae TaxID=2608981 RepID=UPI0012326C80|nr:hypothetical protein [Methylomonas rhizoryzae]